MSLINTQFGDCNIVVVNSSSLNLEPVLGSPLTKYSHWAVGDLASYSTSHPNATITTLPQPGGRMPNYSLQQKVLGCADAFILILDTCGYLGRPLWIKKLEEYQVPVVCWIERINEERCIQEYKGETKDSLLRQYKAQTKLEASKDAETKTVKKDSHGLYSYSRSWPVKDYDTMVKKIKTSFGEETSIFSFESTGLLRFEDESEVKTDFSSVKELFEKAVQELLRVQQERGVNQKVLENKQKNTQIQGTSLGWGFFEELEEEEEKVKETSQEKTKEKEEQTSGLLSGIFKFFSFGSNSKTLKTVKA